MGAEAAIVVVIGLDPLLFANFIAMSRGRANGTGGVFVVNPLLGWSVIGWFVAFIWACSGSTSADKRREEERHRELLQATKKGAMSLL